MHIKNQKFLIFHVILLLICTSCSLRRFYNPSAPDNSPGIYENSLQVDGLERTYLIQIPTCYPDSESIPLVMMFHGGGGQASGVSRDTNWIEKAEQACFLIVFPDGVPEDPEQPSSFTINPQLWNDGSGRFNLEVNDIAFVESLLDHLKAEYRVDTNQIFASGFSNGASMAFRVGLELDHNFAAIAPVAGALWIDDFNLEEPVSLFYMTGTEDPLNPLEGGIPRLAFGISEPGGGTEKPPVEDHIQKWIRALDCNLVPELMEKNDLIEGVIYQGCRGDTVVQYYQLLGVGHHWPGGIVRLPQLYLGKATDQIDATDLIWDFFQAHPRK